MSILDTESDLHGNKSFSGTADHPLPFPTKNKNL